MTWYERARAFTFPKNNPESKPGPGKGAANQTDPLQLKSPPEKAQSQYISRRSTAPSGPTNLTQESVSSYNLDWIELRPFLVKKYPDLKFDDEQLGVEDHFVFRVPENQQLTDEDRHKIEEIRAVHRARVSPELKRTRQEHSPDPPPRRVVDEDDDE